MKSIKWRVIVILAFVATSVLALVPRSEKQRLYNAQTGQVRDSTIRRVPIKLGLDLRGGAHLALEVDESRGVVSDCSDAIPPAERVVRTRIDEFGTTEPVVQVAGNCRLIVELAGETGPARARSIVERTAFLEFRLTDTRDQFRRALPPIDAALQRAGVTSSGGRVATSATTGEPSSDKAITDLLTSRADSSDSLSAGPAAAAGGTFSRLLIQ